MRIIYYTEVNLTCIAFLMLIAMQSRHRTEQHSTVRMAFNHMILTGIVMCLSDWVAGASRGETYAGAHAMIVASNLIFFESTVVVGYFWMQYVDRRLSGLAMYGKQRQWLMAIPLAAFTVVALLDPFTHFLFTVDERNLYSRNVGTALHWVVSWFYLLYPSGRVLLAMRRETNKLKRQEIRPMLYFPLAPAVASITQMLFYGVSSTQVGITFSIAMVFMYTQGSQILSDALTGLNNRSGLDEYIQNHIQRHPEEVLSFLMIDINHFKQINDQYGHPAGDMALKRVAVALKQACRSLTARPFLCRYGGDEFVIAGVCRKEGALRLIELIHQEIAIASEKSDAPPLTVSIGSATGICATETAAEFLLHDADNAMYQEKNRRNVPPCSISSPE